MSLAVLHSRALSGMDAPAVSVEVHLAKGLPSFTIVGLPDTEVRESKDRVRAALANAGFKVPSRRVTVNLAPADLPKESGRFDLPIALGILAASGQLPGKELDQYEFAGELSLSGELRPIRGALAMTFAMHKNSTTAPRAFMLPSANADEAALVAAAHIYPVETLLQVCAHFGGGDPAARIARHHTSAIGIIGVMPPCLDFADVKGQPQAKRALEIAAAGAHNVLKLCANQPLSKRRYFDNHEIGDSGSGFLLSHRVETSHFVWFGVRCYRLDSHRTVSLAISLFFGNVANSDIAFGQHLCDNFTVSRMPPSALKSESVCSDSNQTALIPSAELDW